MRTGAAPLPVLAIVAPLTAIAFGTNHPLVLASVLAAAIVLLLASSAPWRLFATVAGATAVGVAVINPFVATQGDLILVDGPHTAILDFQVTLEEVGYGLAAGVRVAAVTLLAGAFLGLVDRDRLLAGASRLTPRSALATALGARLLPVLRRDATTIGEAARLRGMRTGAGRDAIRTWGRLLVPLTASALERGLDRAEAMAARGYGSGPRTLLPERRLVSLEWCAVAVGAGIAGCGAALLSGLADYRWYPTMSTLRPAAAAAAAAIAILGALGAGTLRGVR